MFAQIEWVTSQCRRASSKATLYCSKAMPPSEEIRLQFFHNCQDFQQVFAGNPVHIKLFYMGVPKFHTRFRVSTRSSRDSKDLPANRVDLGIQIFQG